MDRLRSRRRRRRGMCFPGLMVKMVKTVTVRRLGRRVRGMMYYRKALELQAFLDMAKDEELMKGYKALELTSEDASKSGKAAEVVKNSNDGLWRASFDEFFTLLTKYCRSKYETIHGQNQENAAAEVFEAAIKREMPAELLRASLRHTSEDQQNFLLNFGRKGFLHRLLYVLDLFKLMVACERMGKETLKVGVGRESCVFGALVMETPIYV
ncbi:hypothetical protein Bca4012_006230 [Brassica carinata]